MVSYGCNAISDDENGQGKTEIQRNLKGRGNHKRLNKRKRRRNLEPNRDTYETQKEVEKLKAYQEILELRIRRLEAARSGQIGEGDQEVEAKTRQYTKSEVLAGHTEVKNRNPKCAGADESKVMEESSLKRSLCDIFVGESEKDDLLLAFQPGDDDEEVLEMRDEDVAKLLDGE